MRLRLIEPGRPAGRVRALDAIAVIGCRPDCVPRGRLWPGDRLGLNMDGERLRTAGRWVLGAVLVVAGIGHLTTQRMEFRADAGVSAVPPFSPTPFG